jgi:hypothetical protein
MTMDVYLHVLPNMQQDAISRLKLALGKYTDLGVICQIFSFGSRASCNFIVLLLSLERCFLPRLMVYPLSGVPFSHQNMLSSIAAQVDTSHQKLPESN